jgi:hypothetical protein
LIGWAVSSTPASWDSCAVLLVRVDCSSKVVETPRSLAVDVKYCSNAIRYAYIVATKRKKDVCAIVNERIEKGIVRTDRAFELGVSPLVMGA